MKRQAKKPLGRKKNSQPEKRPSRAKKLVAGNAVPAQPVALLSDVRELIQQARASVARAIDSGLVMLYWHVGQRIRQDILKEKRAEYGSQIIAALGRQLEVEFGRGFSERNLRHMIRFAEAFPDPTIVNSLSTQLGWTHFRNILPITDPLKRDFYAEMCRLENWNTRTLHQKIQSMLFERTAISKKPDALIRQELKQLRENDKLTSQIRSNRAAQKTAGTHLSTRELTHVG